MRSKTRKPRTTIHNLPEELVREILSYAFHLTPDDFCGARTRWDSFSNATVFGRRERGTCQHLLLVSKKWLRIGLPLLYTSLAIRTPAHASTVAAVLDTMPALGRAVRHLKVFGGYGRHMGAIASACPNVETLYADINVKSNESIVGLQRALALLSPVRLHVESRDSWENKKMRTLRTLVHERIAEWPRLREVHYGSCRAVGTEIFTALRLSTTVRELWLDEAILFQVTKYTPNELRALLTSPSFEKLHCLGRSAVARKEIPQGMVDADFPKAARDKVAYEGYPDGDDPIVRRQQPPLPAPTAVVNNNNPHAEDQDRGDEEDDYSDDEEWDSEEEEEGMLVVAAAALAAVAACMVARRRQRI